MKRSNRKRHRPEEVVAKLRQADEALAKGTPIAEVARSLGVSEVTLHRWRAEYGAVDRDGVRRMKELEKENARLKRLVADQQLDIQILKEVALTRDIAPPSFEDAGPCPRLSCPSDFGASARQSRGDGRHGARRSRRSEAG